MFQEVPKLRGPGERSNLLLSYAFLSASVREKLLVCIYLATHSVEGSVHQRVQERWGLLHNTCFEPFAVWKRDSPLFFKDTAPRTSILPDHLVANSRPMTIWMLAKLIGLHPSLTSNSAAVLLKFQFGVNKRNQVSTWGQGGKKTEEKFIPLDQGSFPTMPCEDKGL